MNEVVQRTAERIAAAGFPYWTAGDVLLVNGDCLAVLPLIEAGSVDAVVTDPPYGVGFKYESHDDRRYGYEDWCRNWFPHVRRISSSVLMACGAVNVSMWALIEPFKWQVAWLKPAAMGRSPVGFCNWEPMLFWGKTRQSGAVDVFRACIVPDDDLDGHPCPKPLQWGIKSVECVTTEGQIVLDPFAGSFTTGVACVRTGRQFIGIELEQKYYEIGIKRITDEFDRVRLFEPAPPVQRSLI